MTTTSHSHRWECFRAGGSDQVALDTRTPAHMDADGDLRICIPDVIAAGVQAPAGAVVPVPDSAS